MNSSELKGYLTGLIIGDGHIDKGITKRSFRIKTIYEDFANKIKQDLESCSNFNVSIRHYNPYIKNNVCHKEYWELYIKAHPYFNKIYNHFYDDYKHRRMSSEVYAWLNSAGLANFFMCDGYICLVGKKSGIIKDRRLEICMDRYNKSYVDKMISTLKSKFDIDSSIAKRGNAYRIRILSSSYQKFFDIVNPYIVDSMKYKLHFAYNKRPKWCDDKFWNFQCSLLSANALTSNVEGNEIV